MMCAGIAGDMAPLKLFKPDHHTCCIHPPAYDGCNSFLSLYEGISQIAT